MASGIEAMVEAPGLVRPHVLVLPARIDVRQPTFWLGTGGGPHMANIPSAILVLEMDY
jgi:hypothetical protein